MAVTTTNIQVSTVATPLLTTGTTWAHTRGATLWDPVPFSFFNASTALRVYIGGTSSLTSAQGQDLPVETYFDGSLSAQGENLWAVTTASTATLRSMAGRQ